jgi:hypothetical protein
VSSFDSSYLTDTNSSVSPSFSTPKQIKEDPYTVYLKYGFHRANIISQLSDARKNPTKELVEYL